MTVADSLAAVAQARAARYALRERGLVAGTRAVSVAFARRKTEAWAALTVVAISRRMHTYRLASVVNCLKGCAANIERSMEEAGWEQHSAR